ncbi:FtsW/RodA/SpoVE family cell cycle protein [Maribellus sediminis]|uniref:FtsW/RodA/SpoVE family cell cycle protein n=1 Tax=Maribellus sediminis TaxID=2696285 RepID=UPI00142F5DD8|nr:FtsW/RodA/SpoVE family cell cycle protein [Maribellus sediminis]
MEGSISKIFRGDRVIWAVLILLSMLSLLIVYSATGALAYRVAGGKTWIYLVRHMVFLVLGFGVMLLMVNVLPVKIYSMFATLALYLSIGLLILAVGLKFAGIIHGSGRTLPLGPLSFQPAEVAKISLILFSAKVLGKKQKTKRDLYLAFRSIIIPTGIVCFLISLSDFSTSALLFATIMTMMFVGRIPMKYMLLVVAAGIGFVALMYFGASVIDEPPARIATIKGRIDRFIHGDPNSETGITQADYAKLAIYSGGIFGKGPGHSDVSNYMAAAYNDFIFAIIVEEYGLIIGVFVVFLYLIFFFRGITIVRRATRTFPAFMVVGLTMILVYQAMINIGVSSGALPVTGQPLPWVSYGGTAMIFTAISFGCILSVSYQNQENKEIAEQPVMIKAPDEDYEIEKDDKTK